MQLRDTKAQVANLQSELRVAKAVELECRRIIKACKYKEDWEASPFADAGTSFSSELLQVIEQRYFLAKQNEDVRVLRENLRVQCRSQASSKTFKVDKTQSARSRMDRRNTAKRTRRQEQQHQANNIMNSLDAQFKSSSLVTHANAVFRDAVREVMAGKRDFKSSEEEDTCQTCKGRTAEDIVRDHVVHFASSVSKNGRFKNQYRFLWMRLAVCISRDQLPGVLHIFFQTFGVKDEKVLKEIVPSLATLSQNMVDMENIGRVHLGTVVAGADHRCLQTDGSTKSGTLYRSALWCVEPEQPGDKPRELFAGFMEEVSHSAEHGADAIETQIEEVAEVAKMIVIVIAEF